MQYTKRDKKRIIKIIEKKLRLRFNVTRACEAAGITRQTLMNWVNSDKWISKIYYKCRDYHLDKIESKYVQESATGNDMISSRHVLRTQRTRDWGTYEEQQLIREKEQFENEELKYDTWQEPIAVLPMLKKGARNGLNADMLAFRYGVLPDKLKQTIKDGIQQTDPESIKVAVGVVSSWALYNEQIKKDFKGAVLSQDSITTWQELSNILSAKDIGDDITTLLRLED